MTCCGRFATRHSMPAVPPARRTLAAPAPVRFELVDAGPLTMFGHATGARYHFAERGARVWVDGRDAQVLGLARGLAPLG